MHFVQRAPQVRLCVDAYSPTSSPPVCASAGLVTTLFSGNCRSKAIIDDYLFELLGSYFPNPASTGLDVKNILFAGEEWTGRTL